MRSGRLLAGDTGGGRLLANLLHFARLLRRMGLVVGSSQITELAAAMGQIDVTRRADFYHTARAFLVHSPDEQRIFDLAFNQIWGGSQEWLVADGRRTVGRPVAPEPAGQNEGQPQEITAEDAANAPEEARAGAEEQFAATYSDLEILRRKDFAGYTEEELEAARRFIDSLVWRLSRRPTRRQQRAPKRAEYLDLPRTIRRSLDYGGEIVGMSWRRRKPKPRPLTVICDVSGSMDRYSRLFLHFIHTLMRGPQRVEAFVFGTRLTRITPALRVRSVERALDEVSGLVQDWAGGTRIGESLRTFNYTYARRHLGRGAIAIIISDGWDRGDLDLLAQEIARLHRSVHRLIWLNPLLGDPRYEPLVAGIRAVLPHLDDFLPLHNLASLEELALQLATFGTRQASGSWSTRNDA